MTRSIQPIPAMPVVITDQQGNIPSSAPPVGVDELEFNPVGSHSSGFAIATAQTLTAPTGATKLMLQTLAQNIRYTLDGTAPTASTGFQLRAGDPSMIIPIGSATVVQIIQEAATASLQYQWGA